MACETLLPVLLRDAVVLDGTGGLRLDVTRLSENMALSIAAARRAALENAAKLAEGYEPDRSTTAKQMYGLMVAHLPPQQAIATAIRRLIEAA